MSKLHEILAVEGGLEKAANKLLKESLGTLGKESLFAGQVRRLEMFAEADKHLEGQEFQELTTTVGENLDYLEKPLSKWYDSVLQKDLTNQVAKADLVVEGETLATGIPATTLLGLETKLSKVRDLYNAIPTLAPGIAWEKDEHERLGVYKTEHPVITLKNKTEPAFITVAEATQQHPAQVTRVDKIKDVGRYATTQYSGRFSPLEKAQRLERIDTLIGAVKQARMRANNVEIVKGKIGSVLLKYING